RREIQAATVNECRPLVARIAEELVPPRLQQEARQLGCIGVLVALEKFDPSSGVAFEQLASTEARSEIRRWLDTGACWRKGEEAGGDVEAHVRLTEFASTLSAADRELLFSENSKRVRSRRYLALVERATAFVRGDLPKVHRGRRRAKRQP